MTARQAGSQTEIQADRQALLLTFIHICIHAYIQANIQAAG